MSEQQSTKNNNTVFFVIIAALLLGLGCQYFYFNQGRSMMGRNNTRPFMQFGDESQEAKAPNKVPNKAPRMGMVAVTPPAMSDQQISQVAQGTNTSTTTKTFNITAGNFYFVPNNITVNKGDKVTLVMTNAGGIHNLVIDELAVKSETVQTGNATSVTFTADKTGSFVYYCAVPTHKSRGMWGTLVVK